MEYKILVVDDDAIIRETLKILLEDEGYDVSSVGDGETALEYITRERYDLALLDIRMTGIDGIQTLERIRKIAHCGIAVLIVSGNLTAEIIEKACELGVSGYIHKPFNIDEVIFKINSALNNRRGFIDESADYV
jgi:two-component system nitrogen regulation response regulator NtrX